MRRLLEALQPLHAQPWYIRHGAALGLTLVAFTLHFVSFDALASTPFFPFLPFVIATALLFGRGSGYITTVVSAGLAVFFLLQPRLSFSISEPSEFAEFVLFVGVGVMITAIIDAQDRAYTKLRIAHEKIVASEEGCSGLLSEANHRAMNNYQVIASLLHLYARRAEEPTREDFESAAETVGVIARAQRRLVQIDGASAADSHEFISGLCEDLKAGLVVFRPIQLLVEAEHHFVPAAQAVALGIIINELVTNALKYAFPDDRAGTVTVTFSRIEEEFCLTVRDDGIGMDAARKLQPTDYHSTGLGRKLIHSLVGQMGGQVDVASDLSGTIWAIRFPCKRHRQARRPSSYDDDPQRRTSERVDVQPA